MLNRPLREGPNWLFRGILVKKNSLFSFGSDSEAYLYNYTLRQGEECLPKTRGPGSKNLSVCYYKTIRTVVILRLNLIRGLRGRIKTYFFMLKFGLLFKFNFI